MSPFLLLQWCVMNKTLGLGILRQLHVDMQEIYNGFPSLGNNFKFCSYRLGHQVK